MSISPTSVSTRAWLLAALARFERPLVSYARGLLQDNLELARDVVQDVFLRLSQQPERPDQKDPASDDVETLAPWLFTVCRNRVIDLCRKEGRLRSLDPELEADLPSPALSPDADLIHKDDHARIRALVDTLPPKQRDVIRLKFQSGLSYQQISEITGYSTGNIGWLIHQAVQGLRCQWLAETE